MARRCGVGGTTPTEIRHDQYRPDPPGVKADADDPHADYLAAVADWERADREHHVASVGVACGRATVDDLRAAAARLESATDTAVIERHVVGRRWLTVLRLALDDEALRQAALLTLLDALRPALVPLADRMESVETVLTGGRA